MLKLKVPRLTTETLYSNVAVRAVNGKGAGAWSEEIDEVVTKKAPESQVENQLFASNRNLAAALKDHEAQDSRAHEDNDDGAASDSSSDAPDVVDIIRQGMSRQRSRRAKDEIPIVREERSRQRSAEQLKRVATAEREAVERARLEFLNTRPDSSASLASLMSARSRGSPSPLVRAVKPGSPLAREVTLPLADEDAPRSVASSAHPLSPHDSASNRPPTAASAASHPSLLAAAMGGASQRPTSSGGVGGSAPAKGPTALVTARSNRSGRSGRSGRSAGPTPRLGPKPQGANAGVSYRKLRAEAAVRDRFPDLDSNPISRLLYGLTLREAQFQFRIDHLVDEIAQLDTDTIQQVEVKQTVSLAARVVGCSRRSLPLLLLSLCHRSHRLSFRASALCVRWVWPLKIL